MISKIGIQPSVQIAMKQAKKQNSTSEQIDNKQYVSNPNLNNGVEASNSYGKALCNISNSLDITPLKPIECKNIKDIKGERIYNSKNQLKMIKEEADDTITNNYASENDSNHINYIEVINKTTNKPIFTQHCEQDDKGNCIETYVTKLNPETGKEEAFSCYENGKITYSGKNSINKKGEEVSINKYYDGYGYSVSLQAPNSNNWKYVHISEDKKNIRYTEKKETKKGTIEKNVEFYNGLPLSVEENKRTFIPNLLALEPLLDSDLKPIERFDMKAWQEIVNKADGEVTKYSNGNIETKKFNIGDEEIVAYFDINNQLEKIIAPSLEIKKEGERFKVKEKLGEGKEKETVFSKERINIIYNDNGFRKELYFDTKTNKPIYYDESEVVENEKKSQKTYHFNNFGMVEYIYEK